MVDLLRLATVASHHSKLLEGKHWELPFPCLKTPNFINQRLRKTIDPRAPRNYTQPSVILARNNIRPGIGSVFAIILLPGAVEMQ